MFFSQIVDSPLVHDLALSHAGFNLISFTSVLSSFFFLLVVLVLLPTGDDSQLGVNRLFSRLFLAMLLWRRFWKAVAAFTVLWLPERATMALFCYWVLSSSSLDLCHSL